MLEDEGGGGDGTDEDELEYGGILQPAVHVLLAR